MPVHGQACLRVGVPTFLSGFELGLIQTSMYSVSELRTALRNGCLLEMAGAKRHGFSERRDEEHL